jgi:hypothetical protein
MLFKNSLKIAGCKNEEDAAEVLLVLWQDYITNIEDSWKLKTSEKHPKFIFDVVMRNVDFKLGFFIDRENLNYLMNSSKYKDNVFMSQYESTGQTNVNIKMFSNKPDNFTYDCLVIPIKNKYKPYFITVNENKYKNSKKKEKIKYITFIVFSSSEIILSGRYDEVMKKMYEFFVTTAFTNRKDIEETIREPDYKEVQKIIKDHKKSLK